VYPNTQEYFTGTKSDDELYTKLESDVWFKDELRLTKNGKKKKGYFDPELLYDLSGDHSIKTLHKGNDKACCLKDVAKSDLEGDKDKKEEEIMSEDYASKSNHTKLHQVSASRKAEGIRGGVHFAASPSVGPPKQNGAAGGG
jgi:hypothetical protein